MKLIKPYYEIEGEIDGEKILRHIEKAARTCYKSEHRIGNYENTKKFIKRLIDSGHESTIEHYFISVRFIIDRGISHELVRMRLCSFSQESTRYVNYNNKDHIEFIKPLWCINIPEEIYPYYMQYNYQDEKNKKLNISKWTTNEYIFVKLLLESENTYKKLINGGWKPQEARSVLPNALKTEIVTTANIREWRHIFKLRVSSKSHSQMREIMCPLLNELKEKIPIIFDDIIK